MTMRHAPSGEIKLANILVTTNSGEVQSLILTMRRSKHIERFKIRQNAYQGSGDLTVLMSVSKITHCIE